MDETSKKKVDAILLLARASFTGRRRPSLTVVFACTVLLLTLVGLLTWNFWPHTARPPLLVVAFDQVALPNEEVTLSAVLEPTKPLEMEQNLSGCPLFFQDLNTGERLGKINTDVSGGAGLTKGFPIRPTTTEVMVRYPGEADRQNGSESKAAIFVWPPETSVLIVDVLETLTDADRLTFFRTQNLDIRPRPGAAAALRALPESYRIIYLCRGIQSPSDYRKLKAWLAQVAVPREQFPPGPVLRLLMEEALDSVPHPTVADLKSRFTGKMAGISSSEMYAKSFRYLGVHAYLLGDTKEILEGVTGVKSWKDLAGRIAR